MHRSALLLRRAMLDTGESICNDLKEVICLILLLNFRSIFSVINEISFVMTGIPRGQPRRALLL